MSGLREIAISSAIEMSRSFRIVFEDFRRGRKFWIPVASGILPAVLAAMAVSSTYPRLTVQLTLNELTYVTRERPAVERQLFSRVLNHMLHERISSQAEKLFPLPTPSDSNESKASRPTPSPTVDLKKKIPEPPTPGPKGEDSKDAVVLSSSPTIANNGKMGGSRPSAEEGPGFFAKVATKIKVTNVGSLSSTIDGLGLYIVEEIGGHREVWESHVERDLEIKLPQGQSTEIGGREGKTVLFWRISSVFMDYETVRLLGERLRVMNPSQENHYADASPVLNVLGSNADDRERLLRIANPATRSRLLLVVEVWDVYGRRGSAEVDLLNSRDWMLQTAESVQ